MLIRHCRTSVVLYNLPDASTMVDALWKLVDRARDSGETLNLKGANFCGEYLSFADLRDVYLRGANFGSANLEVAILRNANLSYANLRNAKLEAAKLNDADLEGANLCNAELDHAILRGANLRNANLAGASLYNAELDDASLDRAIMPDGRLFDIYKIDPLAGICDEPEARRRAIEAWGNHLWEDCPMHAAHGWSGLGDAPDDKRIKVAAFVALFDAKHLPKPVT